MPAAPLKLLAQLRALLRSHALPALTPHALSPVSVPTAPPAQTTEEDAAQQQQPERLPVLQRRSPEQLWHERVPQQHYREREQRQDRNDHGEHRNRSQRPTNSTSHFTTPQALISHSSHAACRRSR